MADRLSLSAAMLSLTVAFFPCSADAARKHLDDPKLRRAITESTPTSDVLMGQDAIDQDAIWQPLRAWAAVAVPEVIAAMERGKVGRAALPGDEAILSRAFDSQSFPSPLTGCGWGEVIVFNVNLSFDRTPGDFGSWPWYIPTDGIEKPSGRGNAMVNREGCNFSSMVRFVFSAVANAPGAPADGGFANALNIRLLSERRHDFVEVPSAAPPPPADTGPTGTEADYFR